MPDPIQLGRFRKVYAKGYQEGRRINSVPVEAEWWYTRLMLVADDYGNLPNDTDLLPAKAAPLRKIGPAAVRRMTEALIGADLLVMYSAGGEDYLHMPDFAFHQTVPNGKRTRRYPECPRESSEIQTDPDASSLSNPSVVLSPKSVVRSPEAVVQGPAKAAHTPAFKPPTPEEVRAYCRERGNRVDAERFCDFYASKGWVVGKAKMKDWRAAVRNWEKNADTVAVEAPPR